MDTLDRIKAIVDSKGMTIAELERKADVGNGTIRNWSKSLPTADKLQRVAKVLGTTLDYLVNGEDESSEKAKILAREANNLTDIQLDLIRSMIKEFEKQNKK